MIFFNDRRKAKKAASATTKAQIAAMAKAGTLRATAKPSSNPYDRQSDRNDAHYERSDVKYEASYGLSRAPRWNGEQVSRKEALYRAAQAKDKENAEKAKNAGKAK